MLLGGPRPGCLSPGMTEELCPLPYDQRQCFPSDCTGVRNPTKRAACAVRGAGARVCDHCMQSSALVTARPAVTGLK